MADSRLTINEETDLKFDLEALVKLSSLAILLSVRLLRCKVLNETSAVSSQQILLLILVQLYDLEPDDFIPEGPSTQYFRTLVLKTIPLVAFGTRVLNYLGTWTLWDTYSPCLQAVVIAEEPLRGQSKSSPVGYEAGSNTSSDSCNCQRL